MKDALPQTIYLKDYRVSPFEIEKTELVFDLGEHHTRVTTTLSLLRNPLSTEQGADLVLHGSEGLDLQSVSVDGQFLEEGAFSCDSESLTISGLAGRAVVTTEVLIKPQDNTTMMGLYRSRTMYCTQ